jgi:hypothetical protein
LIGEKVRFNSIDNVLNRKIMKMKNVIKLMIAAAILGVVVFNVTMALDIGKVSEIVLSKNEALAQDESGGGGTSYLKELEYVECPLRVIWVAAGGTINGKPVVVGAYYTEYGTKKACTFWIFASCDQSQITPCKEI